MQVSNFYENVNSSKLAGHPGYEFEQSGNKSKVIGLSHHERNKLQNGYILGYRELKANPDKNDTRKAYASKKPFLVNSSSLRNKNNSWEFDELDKPFIDEVKKKKPI